MTLLVRALLGNAAFSGASGLVLAVAGAPVAGLLGDVPAWTVRLVGIGLVGFSVIVWREARRPTRSGVVSIIAADAGWVVLSALLLVDEPGWLAPVGALLVADVALVVAGLAVLQAVGLRRFEPAT